MPGAERFRDVFRTLWKVFCISLLFYVALICFMVSQQRRVLYPGMGFPDVGANRRGGSVVTGDGFDALWIPPKKAGAPVVVFWHGNADVLGRTPAKVGSSLVGSHGVGFYAIEFPGFGVSKSRGETSEATIYESAEQGLRHLVRPAGEGGLGVHRNDIVLSGQSLGCAVALEMASRGWGSRLVLISPFWSITEMAKEILPLGQYLVAPLTRAYPQMIWDNFDNGAVAQSLRLPGCVLHGKNDEIVPYSQGERLSKLLGTELITYPVSMHNDMWNNKNMFGDVERCIKGK
eukprot:Hpha_TRINITY_DN30936_c0_g1::TRINITY_DN30936_c0_g1_i1::g.112220::m.112220/K06889/K06889; uncharacterized protein